MKQYDRVEDLSIKNIQVFLASADTGSFTKAGEKMHMTQSMVSKNVAAMEKSLGLILFMRNPQGVALTPAGRIIYQSWKNLIAGMKETVAAACAAQGGNFKQVFISDFSTSVKKEYFWPYVRKFQQMYPEADVLLDTFTPGRALERLEKNSCDIVFAPYWEWPIFEKEGVEWKYALRCPLCVWVHESSPLYCYEKLKVEDLKNETFIIVSPMVLTHYEKMVFDICRQAGFEPERVLRVADATAATLNLKLGKGIVIRDSVFDSAEMSDIRVFELEDIEGGTIIAWQSDIQNEYARRFVNMYQTI